MSDTSDTSIDDPLPRKKKHGKTKNIFKYFKIEKKEIFSSKQKYIQHLKIEKRTKKYEESLEEITKLKNFKKIHNLLQEPKTKRAKNPVKWPEDLSHPTLFWNTYPYLVREVQKCLLTKNWNNLTQCLIAFKHAPKQYRPFLFKAALINFTMNPKSKENRLLDDFLRECLSCHNSEDAEKVLQNVFTIKNDENTNENISGIEADEHNT